MASYLSLCFLFFFYGFSLLAKDFGTLGEIFPIAETDLIEVIKKRADELSKEQLNRLQNALQKEIVSVFNHPKPVKNIGYASEYKTYYFDPTIVVKQEIKDHEGKVIVKQGTSVNPLENYTMLHSWIFFDATKKAHLEWAREQKGQWILVKGKPLELEALEEREVFFDQFGTITKKLNIKNVPARVSQEGIKLKIEEIPI